MRTWLVVLLLVLLLPTTVLGEVSLSLDPPRLAPTDGTPFEARLSIEGLEEPAELKAWLGGEVWQASRTWNGTAFERSDRYVLEIQPDARGRWEGWIGLRANPSSRNHPTLEADELATLGVRLRSPSQHGHASAELEVLTDPDHVLLTVPPGAQAQAGELAHRTNPAREPRILALALPPGAEPAICVAGACQADEHVRLTRAGDERLVIQRGGEAAPAPSAAVALAQGLACPLPASLAPGRQAAISLDPPDPGCIETDEATGRPRIVHRGQTLDVAPDPPGWGEAVRAAWDEGIWLPWRLPAGVEPGPVEAKAVDGWARPFTTRSAGLETVLGVIDGAEKRLTVATYLLTHEGVTGALARAALRGVDVSFHYEPTPVGGLPDKQRGLLGELSAAGVQVVRAEGSWSKHGLHHTKLVVADGIIAVVLTENFTYSGLPHDGDGNLGWGIAVANRSLAKQLEGLYERGGGWIPAGERVAGWEGFDGSITVLSTPENTWSLDGVPAAIEASQGLIGGLALRASPTWGPRANPWLSALVNASAEHPVRVLLSGSPDGLRAANQATVSRLVGDPAADVLEARLAPSGAGTVHAKAMVGPGWVLVGSSNWGMGGALLNREINLLIEEEGVSRFFQEAFEQAWGDPSPRTRLDAPSPSAIWLVVVLVGVAFRRVRRTGGPGGSPRGVR